MENKKLTRDCIQVTEEIWNEEFLKLLRPTLGMLKELPKIYIENEYSSTTLIKGTTIKGHIQINEVDYSRNILIEDCVVEDSFCISKGSIPNITFKNVLFQDRFLINGGDFNGTLTVKDCTIEGDVSIYIAKFNQALSFENIFAKKIFIGSGEFKKSFEIKNSTIDIGIDIKNGHFKDGINTSGNFIRGHVSIWGGIFEKDIKTNDRVTFGDFSIIDGIFKGDIIASGWEYRREFLIEGGSFSGRLILNSGRYNQVRISDFDKPISMRIEPSCKILTLKFNLVLHKDSFVQVYSGLGSLIFENTTNLGTIQFVDIYCFKENDIESWIKVTNSNENDIAYNSYVNRDFFNLTINNSDLGKVSFIGSDLSQFKLKFNNSKITETFITGTKMPEKISSNSNEQKQLGYSQIKKIYEARGDKVTANIFLAREMTAYYETLSWNNNKSEKVNLLANKFSTDHGQSWSKGLLTTIGVSCFFYILYCLFLGIRLVVPFENEHISTESINYFGIVTSYFLEFVNPVHKADYIAEELLGKAEHISGWARTTEGISRIFIAYFVYQLIQAFRKHGKS